MKKTSLLLGILVGLAAPLSAQASPDSQSTKDRKAKARTRTVASAPQPQRRTVYYITSNTVAGSHIPTVVRQYRGQNEALNGGFLPNRFFTTGDLDRSNGLNIGASLAQLDPAISVR